MSRHKSFRVKKQDVEPITFDIVYDETLEGDEGPYTKEKVADFSALATQPGAIILEFINDADSQDGGRAAGAFITFINDSVVEEDREKFNELIRNPKISVEIETLAAIAEFLVSEYAKRPTSRSKSSAESS